MALSDGSSYVASSFGMDSAALLQISLDGETHASVTPDWSGFREMEMIQLGMVLLSAPAILHVRTPTWNTRISLRQQFRNPQREVHRQGELRLQPHRSTLPTAWIRVATRCSCWPATRTGSCLTCGDLLPSVLSLVPSSEN